MSSADYGLLAPIWAGRPVATVTGDPALVDAMIEAELALARAQGIDVTPPILDAATLAAHTRDTGNPVPALLAALNDPRLHRGATSQDILDTALMLMARRALTLTALDLDTAIAAAARLATEYRDTPMAARTLTQQAVPTTFGLKAAGWHHLLTTARRAVSATAKALPVQLGGAAGTLASFVALAEADVPYAPHVGAVVTVSSYGGCEGSGGLGQEQGDDVAGDADSTASQQVGAGVWEVLVSSSEPEQRHEGTVNRPLGTATGQTGSRDDQQGGTGVGRAAVSSSEQRRPGATARLTDTVAERTGQSGAQQPETGADTDTSTSTSTSTEVDQLTVTGAEPAAAASAPPPPVSSSGPQYPAGAHLLTDSGHEPRAAGSDQYAGIELLTDSASSAQADPGAVSADSDTDIAIDAETDTATAALQSPTDSALALVGRFARILGLAEPPLPWHVLRTPIAELASTLALAAGALGKVAADVLVLARTEVGEVAEGVGGASSTMPHKANPVRAVLIAGAARQVPALASVLFASVAAEDERPAGAWHAEWQPLREALRLVGGSAATAAELLAGLRVHPERMAENLALLDLAEARKFTGRAVTDPRDYLGAASALVDRVLKETP